MSSDKTLHYILNQPRAPITLNLFEAERYESAVVVQPLVGTLVYYSNKGRYEPRLAKSWTRISPTKWKFELHENLECENGESITPQSFSESLLRTIGIVSSKYPIPVLKKLKGYDEFSTGRSQTFHGISFDKDNLYFEFETPVRSGFLQILSFSSFGYICKENFSEDLRSWRDPKKFISSGAYIADHVEIGEKFILKRNPKWKLPFLVNAPDSIEFGFQVPSNKQEGHWIVDSVMQDLEEPQWLNPYSLVPEYINPILLGNLSRGYFSRRENRLAFAEMVSQFRDQLPKQFGHHVRSSSFYPNQQVTESPPSVSTSKLSASDQPLVIEGKLPAEGTPAFFSWKVLKQVLDAGNLAYKFNNNESTMKFIADTSFDLRLRVTSIGGEVEPWGIELIFCSELGLKLPDPSGRICSLVDQFEAEEIDLEEFEKVFFAQVKEDSAILPISHFGIKLYLSDSIDQETISPALNILRFDQLGLR